MKMSGSCIYLVSNKRSRYLSLILALERASVMICITHTYSESTLDRIPYTRHVYCFLNPNTPIALHLPPHQPNRSSISFHCDIMRVCVPWVVRRHRVKRWPAFCHHHESLNWKAYTYKWLSVKFVDKLYLICFLLVMLRVVKKGYWWWCETSAYCCCNLLLICYITL